MDEELLITLVKEHGELYDSEHKCYQDTHRREAAWRGIAKKMNLQPNECRDRWKQLRDNYRKAMKHRQMQRARGKKKIKAIKYAQIIGFLDYKKLEQDHSQSRFSTTTLKLERRVDQEAPIDPLTVPEKYETTTTSDTVVTFFTNLGETVKAFPEEVQIRVKRDIFQIINEAEEEVLMGRQGRRVRNTEYGLVDF